MRLQDDFQQVTKLSQKIRRLKNGDYTTLVYRVYKKLGKEWPVVDIKNLDDLVIKWQPLLGTVDKKYQLKAAQILALECEALKSLDEDVRAKYIGPLLKYEFPAIIRYFNFKGIRGGLQSTALQSTDFISSGH